MKEAENNKLVSFADFRKTLRGYLLVKRKVFRILGRQIFEIHSFNELIYECLKRVEETKHIQNESNSIINAIQIVRKYYGYPIADELLEIETFCKVFFELEMDQLPYKKLQEAREEVEKDLKMMDDLISKYESTETIKNLFVGNDKYVSQSPKILHFYGRCIEERRKMLDYYMNGMFEDTFNKCVYGFDKKPIFYIVNKAYVQSYNFGKSRFGRNYDVENIDSVTHRLFSTNLEINDFQDYELIYKNDKRNFYEIFFKFKSVEELFQDIKYSLSLIRFSEERKQIFEELERLFHAKEWLAFYAIALPQVEGLFSEMLSTIEPGSRKKALSAKVRAIRAFSNSRERTLDYYEYVLPEQRNRFAHGGLLGDYELRAYDLLTDLENVLSIFSNLDNPFVLVSRLLARKNIIDFPNIDSFVTYFDAIDELKHSQREQIMDDILSFNRDFLAKECQLEELISEGLIEYRRNVQELCLRFSENTGIYRLPSLYSKSDIGKEINDLNRDYFRTAWIDKESEIHEILLFYDLIKEVKKWINNKAEIDFMKELLDQWKNESLLIQNIRKIRGSLGDFEY